MTSRSPSLESVKKSVAAGDLKSAEIELLGLLRENPHATEALHILSKIYVRQQQFDDAIVTLERLSKLAPRAPKLYFELGNAYLAGGRLENSVTAFQQGLGIDHRNPQAHNNLGIALRRNGAFQKAEAAFLSAINIDPELALPHRNLGELSRMRGDSRQALKYFEDAVRLDPKDAESHNGLGMTAATLALSAKAIVHFRTAIELAGTHREAENNLAILLSATGQSEEAANILNQTLNRNPDFVTARVNLGTVLIELGKFSDAIYQLNQVLDQNPTNTIALHHLGDLASQGEYEFTQLQLQNLQNTISANSHEADDQISLGFIYGGILENQKQYADAFDAYLAANQLNHDTAQKRGIAFSSQRHTQKIQYTVDFFDEDFFRGRTQSTTDIDIDSELPIFIVGMPRSGTTLVEQIISSHSQAAGVGELAAIEEISLQIPSLTGSTVSYPECLQNISDPALKSIAQKYLDKLSANYKSSERIVDKTWYNFYFLGLISILFPKAHIIHCLRDPRDVAVSCFFSNFNSIHWSWKIEDIIDYYGSYKNLMQHWHTTLPMRMLEVEYEALVSDQEEMSRKIIDFCDLEWDQNCLEFYRNERAVQTASRVQVRKPIYNKSIGRWKYFETELSKISGWTELLASI